MFEVSMVDLGSSEWKKHRWSFSGTGKVVFFDLDISQTDGSVFEHFIGLHTYSKCVFL